MTTWYFICKIDFKSPHTFGKQLNCSWSLRQVPLPSTASRTVKTDSFTVAFSHMQFRHGSDAIAERQTFITSTIKTFLSFVVSSVNSITFLEFQFLKLSQNKLPKQGNITKMKKKILIRPLSDFRFHIPDM